MVGPPPQYRIGDRMHCKKCDHDWKIKKAAKPGWCPKCKNPNWDEGEKQDGMGRPREKT